MRFIAALLIGFREPLASPPSALKLKRPQGRGGRAKGPAHVKAPPARKRSSATRRRQEARRADRTSSRPSSKIPRARKRRISFPAAELCGRRPATVSCRK